MKKTIYRIASIVACASFAGALSVSSVMASEACQNECLRQHPLEAQWTTPPPSGISRTDYRQQVLDSLKNVNACIAACTQGNTTSQATAAPASGGKTSK